MQPVPGAPGVPGICPTKATTAGSSPPPCDPRRPATASNPTVGTRGHGPACCAPAISPPSLSRRGKRQPSAPSAARVQRPYGIRPPSFGSKPFCSDPTAAPPAGPPGGQPTSGGPRRWAGPHPLSNSSSTNMSERSTRIPTAASGWHKHSRTQSNHGGSRPWSRRCRRDAACSSRERARGWLRSEPSPALTTLDRS
jgi:hypothetical protein